MIYLNNSPRLRAIKMNKMEQRPFEVYTDNHSQIIQAENMIQAIQIFMELNSCATPVCIEDVEPRNKIGDWFAKQKARENDQLVDNLMTEIKKVAVSRNYITGMQIYEEDIRKAIELVLTNPHTHEQSEI